MEDINLSYGEKAVGLTFNPSGDSDVHSCKSAFAREINRLDGLRDQVDVGPEGKRLFSIAITAIQDAQMWAVKAITWPRDAMVAQPLAQDAYAIAADAIRAQAIPDPLPVEDQPEPEHVDIETDVDALKPVDDDTASQGAV